MYPLHPPPPALHILNRSNIFNIAPSAQLPRPKHLGRHPRFTLSSKKASATVSLTNANANASCITTNSPSLISDSDSFSCSSSSESGSQNVIPFPSVPIDIDFPAKTITTTTIVGDSSSRHLHIRPIPRRRRSQAQISHPPPYSHPQLHSSPQATSQHPPSKSRKHTNPSLTQETRPKRARKTRRFLADLKFCAIVHRSIVWRMRTLGVHTRPGEEDYCAMDVDSCVEAEDTCRERERADLMQQDQLLVKRLWCSLMEHGCKPVLFEDISPPLSPIVGPATCIDPEMEMASPLSSYEGSMDVDIGTISPPQSPPSSPSPSPSPPSSPTISTPCPSPTDTPPAEVLSMPQLVATLILRHRERCSVRVRPCARPGSGSGSGGSSGLRRDAGPRTGDGEKVSCRPAEGASADGNDNRRVARSPLSVGVTFVSAFAAFPAIQGP